MRRAFGEVATTQGKWDEAVTHFRAALERNPNDLGTRYQLGKAYRSMNNLDAASKEMSRASEAARHGAIASLVRSVGPFGLQTPHTGGMGYNDSLPKIPTAAITMEDALLLQRMQDRGAGIKGVLLLRKCSNRPGGVRSPFVPAVVKRQNVIFLGFGLP